MKTEDAPKILLNKQELMDSYSALARLPLTAKSVEGLPFHAIPWEEFESLVFRLVCIEHDFENCTPYGYRGQNQEGLDILVSLPGAKYLVYQCKKVQKFTGTEFINEFDLFSKGEWFDKTIRYYLVSSDPLQDTSFIKAFEKHKQAHAGKIDLIRMGANELNTKIRNQPQLVYDFFGEEYVRYFCREPELSLFFRQRKPQPCRPVYQAPNTYIPRRLSKTGTAEHAEESREINLFETVALRIEREKISYLIRSNAAYGKTTEVNQLIYQLNEQFDGLLTLLIRLKHYLPDKHTLSEYLDLLYPDWSNHQHSKIMIVMDGIDEIPINSFAEFTRKICAFLNQYNQIHIVLTIRTNFHNSGFVERISETRTFEEFTIDELSTHEIDVFALKRLIEKKELARFRKLCKQKALEDLLVVPFYLINLLDLFLDKQAGFPKDRREAMNAIIHRRCHEDAAKYDLAIQPATLLLMLKEVSIVMTLKGLNSVIHSELSTAINFRADQLKLSSLLQLEAADLDHRVSFIHANFQEYLFALSVARLNTGHLDEILFSSYDRNRLKSKFLNVTNYLFSLMDQHGPLFTHLYNKLFDHNFEFLALFEKDKISLKDRFSIFSKILDKYQNQQFYFLKDNLVSAERLWEFVNYSPEAFNALLDVVNTGNNSSCAAFLDLLQKYPKAQLVPASKNKLRKLLLEIIAFAYDYAIHDRAIDLLTLFEIFGPEIFKAIKACPTVHFKMVRAGIFDYIIRWGRETQELAYLLESASAFADKSDRLSAGLETKYVRTLVNLLDVTNYRQIMEYLIASSDSCIRIFVVAGYSPALLANFYTKLGEIYNAGAQHHDAEKLLLDFYSIAAPGNREKLGSLIRFFQASQRVFEGVAILIDRKINGNYAFAWIEAVDADFLALLVRKYANKEIDTSIIFQVRMGLARVGQKTVHDAFQTVLTSTFPDEFEYAAVEPDYMAIQRRKRKNDYLLLADKASFLAEAEKIFIFISTKTGKEELGLMDFQSFQHSEQHDTLDACNSDLVFDKLRDLQFHGKLESLRSQLNSIDWEEMIFETVHSWLCYPADPSIPEDLKAAVAEYYQKIYSPHMDFEKAIRHESGDGSFTISHAAMIYTLLYRQGVLHPDQKQLQDLLLIDYSGTMEGHEDQSHLLHNDHLFKIVYQQVNNHDRFTEIVRTHLEQNRIHSNPVMQTFAAIIRHYNLPGMQAQLLCVLMDSKWNDLTKEEVLKTYQQTGADAADLLPLMNGLNIIDTEWKWQLLKLLEDDQGSPGAYAHLPALLPANLSRMLGWENEQLIYTLKHGSVAASSWFFTQLKSNLTFDCGEKQINSWIEAIIIGSTDLTELMDQALAILELEVIRTTDRAFCRRREMIHTLLRKLILNNHSLYSATMTKYHEMVKRHEGNYPRAKEHYGHLYEFEKAYYLESIDNPDEHFIPQIIAGVQ
jgi:hypothetical protein